MFHKQPQMLASAFYLFFFAAAGAVFPYLTLYYQSRGISKQHIGYLVALATFTAMVASPLWSGIADARRIHKRLLVGVACGTLIPVLLLMQASSFAALVLSVLLFYVFLSPIVSLADNAILSSLDNRETYGKLRLWGAVGWGLVAWGAGIIAERSEITFIFLIFLVFMVIDILVMTRLPVPKPDVSENSYFADLKQLLGNASWLGFLASIFLAGMVLAIFSSYFSLYLIDLGAGEGLFGLSVAIASLTEIPVFFLSPLLLKRIRSRGLLYIAFLALMVRGILYSVITDPYLMLGVQLLHGFSFAGMWAAAVVYVSKIAPPRLGATAQSTLGLVAFGLAGVTGALLGGSLYDSAGPVTVFRVAALAGGGAIVVFWFTGKLEEMRAKPADVSYVR
ncbi:MAG: MFS transporter [Chloroflexi bacterium]|nr:MFS transporter [Chloroflexota bacterium]